MITITINGKERKLDEPISVATFLKASGIDSQFVAVARNGVVLERQEFPRVVLQDGDVVEIVRPVGGG
ncbi:MAG: sulfur carrier protein ThiS [Chloroflexi bacterium]|nr:sulfur carrier protein ThiS [Chloroflexota bacterium]